MNFLEIFQNFESDKPKKTVFGNYRIEGDKLIYRAQVSEDLRGGTEEVEAQFKKLSAEGFKLVGRDGKRTDDKPSWGMKMVGYESETVAVKILRGDKTIRLGNGSILSLIGRVVSYGHERRNSSETEIQREMRGRGYIMVPFSVFEAAKLDIKTFELVEQGPEETLKVATERYDYRVHKNVKRIDSRHFVGASLFKVGGKSFLFDIDRREIRYKIFNPFLVELKASPKTIEEAYESLKPAAVRKAEAAGLKVMRQGEWFFVPTKAPKLIKLSERERIELLLGLVRDWGSIRGQTAYIGAGYKTIDERAKVRQKIPQSMALRAGSNRPNQVETALKQDGKIFCTGKISHSGREHKDLILKGWYLAIPNTSVGSFTLTGDVD